ncbi:ankyrin repeat-containing domain protein [Lophiotrema nucula]|uniref:Ankyrin repeat-containing domain protein n=1 Tax=Lophiotrema nucula TaxID=690887 RepID=A0A6A5Z2U5_9PLEO|nr:ankyrin repeat-containing domain protein [Lophiotrema nucula]
MTKDWESVRPEIRELSVGQKKSLQEVKTIMEKSHQFRASTRAYRMRLKDWGYLRHKPRKGGQRDVSMEDDDDGTESDRAEAMDVEVDLEVAPQSDQATPIDPDLSLLDEADSIIPTTDPWSKARSATTSSVMEMLGAILDSNSMKLEQLILKNPNHINYPIGLPFEAHGGRYFGHPAMLDCVILQHPDQTLLDIACGLPSGPVVWVLVAHGAKGSKHPLGTDLAFHNAIKNGRTFTVQSLLFSGLANANGVPEVSWKPLLQATFWTVPEIVRLLLDRGAEVNYCAPTPLDGMPHKTALQLALDRRATEAARGRGPIRDRCDQVVKLLLDAGADIHASSNEDEHGESPFECFIKPWQGDPHWAAKMSPTELACLEILIKRGANLHVAFRGFSCTAPSTNTFEHQILWHSTPLLARIPIDNVNPALEGMGSNLLHEIVGSCPEAKRHPSDTLRDIAVLLRSGADVNHKGNGGHSPLWTCIERCPAVDIVPRLQALLDAGADPILLDDSGARPIGLVARSLDDPLLSQVMELLISKLRMHAFFQDISIQWSEESYFPIPTNPTAAQVLRYNEQQPDFVSEISLLVPKEKIPVVVRAAFSIASKNFLDAAVDKVKTAQKMNLTATEKVEIHQLIAKRKAQGLPDFAFDQYFVMSLLMPTSTAAPQIADSYAEHSVAKSAEEIRNMMEAVPGLDLPTSLQSNLPTPLPMDTPLALDVLQPEDSASVRRASISSASSNVSSSSFFIPTTTQIRWPSIGRATRPDDKEKARGQTLKYRCKSCTHEPLLTEAEFKRHEEEHWHTLSCKIEGCQRRFCIAERG